MLALAGCGAPTFTAPQQQISSVTPSAAGTPNSVAVYGQFEFVSVQGTGQIFTYNLASGSQVQAGQPYTTPCADPSGMVVTTIAAQTVMAAVCFDTGSLLTLTVNADGSLHALGSVGGLPEPYPGIALDGVNVFVPLWGGSSASGAVAKVSLATPSTPAVLAVTTLASAVSGGTADAGYLAVAGGNVYVAAGSESNPLGTSSTIQVINEATMALVGSPFVVDHSPQQIAIVGSTAYVSLFDADAIVAISIANPASLQTVQTIPTAQEGKSCNPEPVAVQANQVYAGCFTSGTIEAFSVSSGQLQAAQAISGVSNPQRITSTGNTLLVTGASLGGKVYEIRN